MMISDSVDSMNSRFAGSAPEEVMAAFAAEYPGALAFSTSLGAEDQALTHMIAMNKLPVKIFTLDTGRLFQETYDLMEITRSKYGIRLEMYFPDAAKVEEMTTAQGVNLFFGSVENRRLCCHIRKREPLKRALDGMKVWITGMRRDQSVTRSETTLIEWDEELGVIKLNPLVLWTNTMVWDFIHKYNIPVNELHKKGFPSIGCQPCTRAVLPGEDIRSGRWWWEQPQNKECGLHQ